MLLKGMVESSLLFKDEPLTPNIDKVMPVWTFRRRAQNMNIGKNWQKNDFSDLVFIFFLGPQKRRIIETVFSKYYANVPDW